MLKKTTPFTVEICVRVVCIINNTYRREFHIHSFGRLSTWRDSLHHYYLCGCTLSRSHPPECALGSFLTNRLAPSGGWKHQGGLSWCVRGVVGRVAAGILHLYILYAGSVVVGRGVECSAIAASDTNGTLPTTLNINYALVRDFR